MAGHIPRAQEAFGDEEVLTSFERVFVAIKVGQRDFSLKDMNVLVLRERFFDLNQHRR